MTKEDFYKVWKDSTKEEILNQYYYDYTELKETIDKAIEYIKLVMETPDKEGLYSIDLSEDEVKEVLKILKGE